jgi:hypothetical protein
VADQRPHGRAAGVQPAEVQVRQDAAEGPLTRPFFI